MLVAINIALFNNNRTVQLEVAKQQQFINQSIRLSRLNTQLIRALATASVQNNDPQIRELLNAHGVTYSVNDSGVENQQ